MSFSSSQAASVRASLSEPAVSRRQLRIALFSGNYDCVRDGANRALNRLVGYLQDVHDAQIRIYSPQAPQPAFASVGEVRAVRSLSLPGRPEYRLALGFTRSARADFDAFAPNLVHLSAPDILGWQALHHAKARSIPVVASLHTRFETYADYYRLGFLRGPIERYLENFYAKCDKILVPTPPIAEDLMRTHGSERVGIWSRGVDRQLFNSALRSDHVRASYGFGPEDTILLFFGRLVREKGLDVFADTIARLRERGNPVRPLIVGDGPARAWLARHLPNATFAGHLESPALERAIASADILINPSVTEAFGNVNLEAMASGLSIISADVPSAASLIEHGKSGLLVEPKDAGAYADAVDALIQNPDRRRRMSAMASAAADAYRWSDVLSTVYTAYQDCLEPAPPLLRGLTLC